MKNNKKLLVIIPAFNEAKNIKTVVDNVKNHKYDYLVVNDCSYDATDLICEKENYNFISNDKNIGLSKTMRNGFRYALENEYEYAVQFDADGQHEILTIDSMLKKAEEGYDIVSSSRFMDSYDHDEKTKVFIWRIFRRLIKKYCKTLITDSTCGLRMYSEKFMKAYVDIPKFEVEPSTIAYSIKKLGMKFIEVQTIVHERMNGESYFKNKKKIIGYILKQIRRLTITTRFWRYHKKNNEEKKL